MNPEAAKRLRLLASAVSVILLLTILGVAWAIWRIRASLPQLDGSAQVSGLAGAVTIERDALGVPTIRGGSRPDVSRAIGWLHGQDRFFQIDVLRRVAAGELSEIFGERAIPRDRATRMHGFRKLARTVVTQLDAEHRAILEAYAAGVNSGLTALRERPFEYFVLREQPRPWLPEDSILIIFAMTLDLQDEAGEYERTLMTIRDQFGLEGLAFFAPMVTPTDAALDGSTAPLAPIPGPRVIDLRRKKLGVQGKRLGPSSLELMRRDGVTQIAHSTPHSRFDDSFPFPVRDAEAVPGSNAFALDGAHTASGAAMLANDMHLDHGVPNIWYRASIEYAGRKITGVTLPGAPAIVAGSNGSVAWGFTNSYVDTGDLVEVEVNSAAPFLYRAPGHDEYLRVEERAETIRVKGKADVVAEYKWTIWGPIVGVNERKAPLAHRMVVHDPAATNLGVLDMEKAATTDDAIRVAHRAGMPAQNILIADKAGQIAWTIAGRLPKRVGYDGRLPVSWTFGDRKWDGYLSPAEIPAVRGNETSVAGRLWSANHRHLGGEAMTKLGDGALRRAPRAAQIRDDLAVIERATPRDLLGVQLDDRAVFLAPWHALMMETLAPAVIAEKKPRAALRGFAEKWEGRASIDAVSYRLVREFRTAVHARVFAPIFASCVEAFPQFSRSELQLEGALWAILREKPMHLLSPEFSTWKEMLVAAIDDVIKVIDKEGVKLPMANWGWRNQARIRHPFTYSTPWLSRWLNMPTDPLPGDADMPRVQSPTHGASERLVVSPGREQEGIFHMPCGQSAHPLSPFFRAGHEAWVRGEPTPFLPGATEHTLTLRP
jgi:penicillin amidase